MTPSLGKVGSDRFSYTDREFIVHGAIDTSSTYLQKHDDAQDTHYAFVVADSHQGFYCYGLKENLVPVCWNLLDDGYQKGRFMARILPNRFLKGQTSVTAELLGLKHLVVYHNSFTRCNFPH